ncbi:hypothetical protein [Marinoscillum sp. MHG1-6]|uniref:hypothetical protein n=1 Tax=Marinoscillum sp. MHG1-6 TaxID=2959627 RepID=UPI00215790B1|nr:hypothetical protein [Marinoscillum sp. MHG1-6]
MRKILILIAAIIVNVLLYYSVFGSWGHLLFENFQTINEETAFRDGAITMSIGNLLLALPITLILAIFIHTTNKYGERFKKLYIPSAIGIQVFWFAFLIYSGYQNYVGNYPENTPRTSTTEIDEYLNARKVEVLTMLDSAVMMKNSELDATKKDSLMNIYRTLMNEVFNQVAEYANEMNIPQEKFDSFHETIDTSEQLKELRKQTE